MAEIKYVSLDNLDYYDGKIKELIQEKDDTLKSNLEGQVTVVANALDGEITRAKAAESANATAAQNAQAAADAAQGDATANAEAIALINDGTNGILAKAKKYTDDEVAEVQASVDTLSGKIGDVPADSTVMGIITNIQENAYDDTEITERIDGIEAEVDTLIGSDAGKSVRTIANEELAKQLIADGADEALNTLEEIAAWIQSHPDDAAAMNAAIEALQNKVDTGDKTVSAYVTDAITALKIGDYAKAADLTALAGRVTALEGASATHATKTEVQTLSDSFGEYKDAHAGDYTNTQIEGKITEAINGEVTRADAELAKKVDKVEGYGLSKNDLSDALKANYDAAYTHSQAAHAPANAQANIIESVKVNGSALTITGKAVDIPVPTDNAQLTNGAGYLVANDIANKADKGTTLAAYGISDAYTSAQTDTAIANAMAQIQPCTDADINGLFA